MIYLSARANSVIKLSRIDKSRLYSILRRKRLFPKPQQYFALCLVAISVIFASCKSFEPRGQAMGKDYLDTEFKCNTGALPHENDARLKLFRDFVHKMWEGEKR